MMIPSFIAFEDVTSRARSFDASPHLATHRPPTTDHRRPTTTTTTTTTTMDFRGQRAAERAAKTTLVLGAVVAYLRGWLAGGDFGTTMRTFAWSVLVACVVSVPPWSVYRMHPVTWRPREGATAGTETGTTKTGTTTTTNKKKTRGKAAPGTPSRTRRASSKTTL